MSILAAILALVMGLVLGLLGGGGSILTVPILVYVLEVSEKSAIATSLLVVGATSAMALLPHARSGNVVWRTGLVFGVFGMMGAYLGGLVAQFIPGGLLLILFALLMLVTGVMMLRGKKKPAAADAGAEGEDADADLPIFKVAAEGLVVGMITGLVGAGGGFLVVPALALLGGMSMKRAIGTSLLVIAMKSFAGFAGFAGHVSIDYELALTFVGAAVVGTFVGAAIARRMDATKLRTVFAIFVLVMAVFIIFKQADAEMLASLAALSPLVWVGLAALVVGAGVAFVVMRRGKADGELPAH